MLERTKVDCLVEILWEWVVKILELVCLATVVFTTPVDGADEEDLNYVDT